MPIIIKENLLIDETMTPLDNDDNTIAVDQARINKALRVIDSDLCIECVEKNRLDHLFILSPISIEGSIPERIRSYFNEKESATQFQIEEIRHPFPLQSVTTARIEIHRRTLAIRRHALRKLKHSVTTLLFVYLGLALSMVVFVYILLKIWL